MSSTGANRGNRQDGYGGGALSDERRRAESVARSGGIQRLNAKAQATALEKFKSSPADSNPNNWTSSRTHHHDANKLGIYAGRLRECWPEALKEFETLIAKSALTPQWKRNALKRLQKGYEYGCSNEDAIDPAIDWPKDKGLAMTDPFIIEAARSLLDESAPRDDAKRAKNQIDNALVDLAPPERQAQPLACPIRQHDRRANQDGHHRRPIQDCRHSREDGHRAARATGQAQAGCQPQAQAQARAQSREGAIWGRSHKSTAGRARIRPR